MRRETQLRSRLLRCDLAVVATSSPTETGTARLRLDAASIFMEAASAVASRAKMGRTFASSTGYDVLIGGSYGDEDAATVTSIGRRSVRLQVE